MLYYNTIEIIRLMNKVRFEPRGSYDNSMESMHTASWEERNFFPFFQNSKFFELNLNVFRMQ